MKEIENIFVESVEQFLEEMVPRLGFQRYPIYRGQACGSRSLLPGLFREEVGRTEFTSWAELEGATLQQLKQEARGELGYEPTSELEWMAAAEHHGLPTRLTAWTKTALVALYFATESHKNEDGVVWRILPGDSRLVISQDYEQAPDRVRIYLPQNTTPAMRNQRTCYLSHPLPRDSDDPVSFEEYYKRAKESLHLARIVIPAREKEFIRRQLAIMGYDAHMIFPGMAGLCRQIREEIYSHTDSYEWVFPGSE